MTDFEAAYRILRSALVGAILSLDRDFIKSDAIEILRSGLMRSDKIFEPKVLSQPVEEKEDPE